MADRKADIIKYVSFTVDHSAENDYGDLMVTSKSGKEYKIGNKRANLFSLFQPDTEVVVGYASYMNKDYIAVAHTADQFPANITVEKEKPAQEKLISPSPAVEKTAKPEPQKVTTVTPKVTDSKNKSYALSYSKDLVSATLQAGQPLTKNHIKTVVRCANIFEAYLDGKIEFDEKQLAEFVLELNRAEH